MAHSSSLSPKTIGILLARMDSARLPGKSLKLLAGQPLVGYALERMRLVQGFDELWLATTDREKDDPLRNWAQAQGLSVLAYTGEADDIVGRISATLEAAGATRFVLVLGDTPFPDPRLMSRFLAELDTHPDWQSVTVDQTAGPCVHSGLACYTREGWQAVDQASETPHHREHAGSILAVKPDLILRGLLQDEPLYYQGPFRLTVDTQTDFELAEHLVLALGNRPEPLPLAHIIEYLMAHPEVAARNQGVRQKTIQEQSMRILIAVQAGGDFGAGHLARCKTLARRLQDSHSASVSFWLDTPILALRQQMIDDGWSVLNEDWSLTQALAQNTYDRLVIDFKDLVTADKLQALRHGNPELCIALIDNGGSGCQEADLVVYPNAHSLADPAWSKHHPAFYQGAAYTILGAHFAASSTEHHRPEETGDAPRILVTMGGVDPRLLSERVLKALKSLKDCHIDLIVPPMYPYPENLETIATRLPSTITLHWKVDNLMPMMQSATLAICSFGVTAYELAYMGVPTLLLAHYSGQLDDMERFTRHGSALNLGLGEQLDSDDMLADVASLLEDDSRREQMAKAGCQLIDGQGAQRVADLIYNTSHKHLSKAP